MTPDEIKTLWGSVRLDKDGLITFTGLVRYFTDWGQARGLPAPPHIPLLQGNTAYGGIRGLLTDSLLYLLDYHSVLV